LQKNLSLFEEGTVFALDPREIIVEYAGLEIAHINPLSQDLDRINIARSAELNPGDEETFEGNIALRSRIAMMRWLFGDRASEPAKLFKAH